MLLTGYTAQSVPPVLELTANVSRNVTRRTNIGCDRVPINARGRV